MTLIEVVIAMALLMITSTALIQTAMLSVNANVANDLRDEAVSVAEQRLHELRTADFTGSILAQTATCGVQDTPPTVTRIVRKMEFVFTLTRTVKDLTTTIKHVSIKVDWSYKGNKNTLVLATTLGAL